MNGAMVIFRNEKYFARFYVKLNTFGIFLLIFWTIFVIIISFTFKSVAELNIDVQSTRYSIACSERKKTLDI